VAGFAGEDGGRGREVELLEPFGCKGRVRSGYFAGAWIGGWVEC
jgi:hypothetical protein